MRLTQRNVAALTMPAGKSDHVEWDDELPGFGVRLRAGGKRTWIVQYRSEGVSRKPSLGDVAVVPADRARRAAKDALATVQLGSDPQAEKEAKALSSVTLGAVAERYLSYARDRLKPRSFEEVERHMRKHWKPLAGVPLHKITRALISARLEEIARDSGPIASNRARAAISALFSWAMRMGLAENNPVVGSERFGEEESRDHVLTDHELAAVWRTSREDDYGRIVRLLILTGQRREEVASIAWSELDLDNALWSIPASRTKNREAHDVPQRRLQLRGAER